jgi:hypothetical protein
VERYQGILAFQLFQRHEMANICKICRLADQESVRAAFASNATDRQLAQQFGVSHAAIGRHRRAHIVVPLKIAVAALDRGRTAHRQREQQLAAIEQGDPVAIATASLGLAAQVAKLERIEGRLERMAAVAEANQSTQGVAVLSGQQLRSVEVGSRLAGTGGFAAPKAGAVTGVPFNLTINFVGKNYLRLRELHCLRANPGSTHPLHSRRSTHPTVRPSGAGRPSATRKTSSTTVCKKWVKGWGRTV